MDERKLSEWNLNLGNTLAIFAGLDRMRQFVQSGRAAAGRPLRFGNDDPETNTR